MDKRVVFLSGLGIGAGAMFLLDPDRGKRRRALIRDQAIHMSHTSKDALEKTGRDLRNRAVGVMAETKALFTDGPVPESVLVDRVRARLGRFPVHHRSIQIEARDGLITLTGDALAGELEMIMDAVSSVRGVNDVANNLMMHETAEGISSLQGTPAGAESASWH